MARGLVSRAAHAVRHFLLRRLPACKQMTALMSESLERPLTLRERVALRLHLWVCVWCAWYLEQLHTLRASLRAGQPEPQDSAAAAARLSLEARERIKRALKGES